MEGFCLINCLRFAADRGVRVINLSWGGPVPTRATVDDPFRTSIVGFCNTGGIVAIAAGNDAQNNIQPNRFVYPSVFATDLAGKEGAKEVGGWVGGVGKGGGAWRLGEGIDLAVKAARQFLPHVLCC